MIVILDPIEPVTLNLRQPVGVPLDLHLTLLDQQGAPVDPDTLHPQLVLTPRTVGTAYGYACETFDAANGEVHVELPGNFFTDRNGYRLELYARADDGTPTALMAMGTVLLSGGAYTSLGPLGPMSVPTIEGPPGPEGQPGADSTVPGPQGERGSMWFSDHGPPTPKVTDRPGDMYLDEDTGDVWRFDETAGWGLV